MASIATENVLVTDIIGSTAVLSGEGVLAAERQRHRHDALVRAVVGVFGGRIVKSTGDGVLALLPSADHLVRSAAALQQAAAAAELPLRVGASTGDVVHEGGDCFGEAVIIAFRLCDRCAPGAILIDAATATIRGGRRDPPVVPHSRVVLRGFDHELDVFTVAMDEAGATTRVEAQPVVGRTDVISGVRSAWRSTPGSLVVLSGIPGIGKTHLAAALASSSERAPWWVAFEPQQTDGFARWCAFLDQRAAALPLGVIAALGPLTVSRLAVFLPSVRERLPVEPAPLLVDSARDESFDALIDLVRVAGRDTVLVCDDLQWAGPTLHAFLTALVSRAAELRLSVVATCRPPLPAAVSDMRPTVFELGGLSREEVEEILVHHGVSPEDAAAVACDAGGNPLLALLAARPGSPSVDDAVSSLFVGLPADTVELVRVAAVIGRTVDLPLVARVTGTSVDDVVAGLDPAVQAGLLRSDGGTLAFMHDVVREAAERRLPAHRQAVLHARAADGLLERGDEPGSIGHCLAGFPALDPDDAVRRIVTGCELLLNRQAAEDVQVVAGRLVDAVERDARCRPRHLAAALLMRSRAHQARGDVAAHKEAALAAAHAALSDDDPAILARTAVERAAFGMVGLPDAETSSLLDEALSRLHGDDDANRGVLLSAKAFYLNVYESRGEEARRCSLDALTAARRSGDAAALATTLANRLFVLNAASRVSDQLAVLHELEALRDHLPPDRRPAMEATLLRHAIVVRLQLADRLGFAELHTRATELAAAQSNWVLRSLAKVWDGLVALLDGLPDEAERRAWELLERKDPNFRASAAGLLTGAHRWRGTLDLTTDAIVRFARESPGLPIATGIAATTAAISGDRPLATELLDDLLGRPTFIADDSTYAAQLAVLTEACVLTHRPIPAQVIDALQAFSGQLLVLSWGVEVPGAADRYVAIARAAAGDDAAAEAFGRAADLEARVSDVLPLRTLVWRSALLGDVEASPPPAHLPGLELEAAALRDVPAGASLRR